MQNSVTFYLFARNWFAMVSHLKRWHMSKHRLWIQRRTGFFFLKLTTRLAFRLSLKDTSSFESWITCSNSFCLLSVIYSHSLCRFGKMFLEVKLKDITVWNNHMLAERQQTKVKQFVLFKIECTNWSLKDKQVIQPCYYNRKWSKVSYTVSQQLHRAFANQLQYSSNIAFLVMFWTCKCHLPFIIIES